MKKKYLFFAALSIIIATAVSGCYVERGYNHPYYHHPHHHYYQNY